MQTVLEGADTTITVSFEWDGEPFVPDSLDLYWSLRGHDGTVLVTETAIEDVIDTRALINIDAANQTVEVGKRFEKRHLVVRGTRNDAPFQMVTPYRVTPFLNYTATAAEVRQFIGLDSGELPDAEVDLVQAYFDIANKVGDSELATALQDGGQIEQATNLGIVGQAVLNLLPSLPARISKSESDGNRQFERFKLDLELLRANAAAAVSGAIAAVGGESIAVAPTLIVFTTRTDPFTGV